MWKCEKCENAISADFFFFTNAKQSINTMAELKAFSHWHIFT